MKLCADAGTDTDADAAADAATAASNAASAAAAASVALSVSAFGPWISGSPEVQTSVELNPNVD